MSTLTATSTATPTRQVDPRGLRVSAAITAAVLALILVLPATIGVPLLAAQVVVFALSALVGLQYSPYSQFFARVVRPRIGAPLETEDARPPRFAQVVGLAFTASGLLALLAGATAAGLGARRVRAGRRAAQCHHGLLPRLRDVPDVQALRAAAHRLTVSLRHPSRTTTSPAQGRPWRSS